MSGVSNQSAEFKQFVRYAALICFAIFDSGSLIAAESAQANEQVDTASGQASSGNPALSKANTSEPVLHSSAEEHAALTPSLKVLIAPPQNSAQTAHTESNVRQFSGGQTYSPGHPAPLITLPPIKSQTDAKRAADKSSSAIKSPEIWNYTLTPRNGIMTWAPGYSVTDITPKRILTTHVKLTQAYPRAQVGRAQSILPALDLRPVPKLTPSRSSLGLKAIELALPKEQIPPVITWDEWYARAARAVYDQWQQDTVGPGSATLLITVFNSHDVDSKVIDFSPAAGASRDAALETKFRSAAIRAVSSLNGAGIWEFPIATIRTRKVAFTMEFKRAVGESAGCYIVHTHDSQQLSSMQAK
jgi:hypothetical protein